MTLHLAASHPRLLPVHLTIAIHTSLHITHSLYRNAVRNLCRRYTFVACEARGRARCAHSELRASTAAGLADDFRNAPVRERWTRSESRSRLRSSSRNNIADVVPPSLMWLSSSGRHALPRCDSPTICRTAPGPAFASRRSRCFSAE